MAKSAAKLKVVGGKAVVDSAVKKQKAPRMPGLGLDNLPKVQHILGFRSVWVLAQLSKDRQTLRATHYCVCLVMGRPATWGVFTIGGKFLRYATSREQISEVYSNHVWRRVPARWQFEELYPSKTIDRKNYLLTKYGDV